MYPRTMRTRRRKRSLQKGEEGECPESPESAGFLEANSPSKHCAEVVRTIDKLAHSKEISREHIIGVKMARTCLHSELHSSTNNRSTLSNGVYTRRTLLERRLTGRSGTRSSPPSAMTRRTSKMHATLPSWRRRCIDSIMCMCSCHFFLPPHSQHAHAPRDDARLTQSALLQAARPAPAEPASGVGNALRGGCQLGRLGSLPCGARGSPSVRLRQDRHCCFTCHAPSRCGVLTPAAPAGQHRRGRERCSVKQARKRKGERAEHQRGCRIREARAESTSFLRCLRGVCERRFLCLSLASALQLLPARTPRRSPLPTTCQADREVFLGRSMP